MGNQSVPNRSALLCPGAGGQCEPRSIYFMAPLHCSVPPAPVCFSLFPLSPQLVDNRNCVLCMECLKACPHRRASIYSVAVLWLNTTGALGLGCA